MVHRDPMEDQNGKKEPWGPRLEPGPNGELIGEHLVAGFATEPGWAQSEKVTAFHRKNHRGRVHCHTGGSEGQKPQRTRPGG